MQTTVNPHQIRLGIGEQEAAAMLGLSVHTLRKDRVANRRIPFYKVGGRVLYNVDRLRETLASLERGGPQIVARKRA